MQHWLVAAATAMYANNECLYLCQNLPINLLLSLPQVLMNLKNFSIDAFRRCGNNNWSRTRRQNIEEISNPAKRKICIKLQWCFTSVSAQQNFHVTDVLTKFGCEEPGMEMMAIQIVVQGHVQSQHLRKLQHQLWCCVYSVKKHKNSHIQTAHAQILYGITCHGA